MERNASMLVQVVSDLHLELGGVSFSPDVFATKADIVLLPGDINYGRQAVRNAATLFSYAPHIVMVCGNHEHYEGAYSIDEMAECMREEAEIRVVGATLWADFDLFGNAPLGRLDAKFAVNDFKTICGRDSGFITTEEIEERHFVSREYVRNAIEEHAAHKAEGPLLVLSHHAPSSRSIAPSYKFNRASVAYASNLDALLARGVSLWAHGHTHNSFCYGGDQEALVVCNPAGYSSPVGEPSNAQFDPRFCVKLTQDEQGDWLAKVAPPD
jgi:predicted phosphohydrolase